VKEGGKKGGREQYLFLFHPDLGACKGGKTTTFPFPRKGGEKKKEEEGIFFLLTAYSLERQGRKKGKGKGKGILVLLT